MTQSETTAETQYITRSLPRPPAQDSRSISRRMIAVVAAAATALGLLAGTSVPARADSDDLAKALAALAIVGILASQANRGRAQQFQNDPRHDRGHQPRQARHPQVPSTCAIEITGNTGIATVYGENCLRQQGVNARLPEYCARTARIFGQRDRIYSDQCLREAGFRVGGARY